jgi:folate-binding Fe-S cluster repair protein YgfZ
MLRRLSTLRSGATSLYTLSKRSVLAVEGRDALPYLQGLTTNDTVLLTPLEEEEEKETAPPSAQLFTMLLNAKVCVCVCVLLCGYTVSLERERERERV